MKDPVILFDFDGVVADSFEVFFREFKAVCSEMHFRRLNSERAFLKLFEGNLLRELLKKGFPVWRLKRLLRRFEPRIREANLKVEPFDDMPVILNELAAAYPVYVITSNVSETVEAFLRRFEVEGIRDILGADKEASKVKKIRLIAARHPEHAPYYIGDTKGDMLEARRAGAVAVAAGWGWHPEDTLRSGKPDHFLRLPEDLRGLFLNGRMQEG
jgi:phosphoglycolate phosphatase